MITIFQASHGAAERDPVEYLERYASSIRYTGELFEYLKLATWDEESPLGWKPTDRLLKIIGMKAASLSRPRPLREEHFYPFLLEILHDAASPTNHFIDLRSFTYSVLRALGLVYEDRGGGDLAPTSLLLQLFSDAYYGRIYGRIGD